MVWHVGLWQSAPPSNLGTDEQRRREDAFYEQANRRVEAFQERLGVPPEKRLRYRFGATTGGGGDQALAVSYVPVDFRIADAVAKAVFTRNDEFVTVTFIVDLSKRVGAGTLFGVEGPEATALVETLKAHLLALDHAFDAYEARQANEETRARLRAADEFLHEGFWTRFAELTGTRYDAATLRDELAEVFVDLRGVALTAVHERLHHLIPADGAGPEDHRAAPRFSEEANRRTLRRLSPLMSEGRPDGRDVEYIACNMLDRGVLYVSALAEHGSESPRPHRPTRSQAERALKPLRYLLLANGVEGDPSTPPYQRWQLGRLVFRINELETNRLFALRGLATIKSAGREIKYLGHTLDTLYENEERRRTELEAFFRRLNGINDTPHGGLFYRVNRVRQLRSRVERLVADLRVGRIEGWQPYDEFVRRRVFSLFDRFDRTGARLDALYARANTLLGLIDARTELQLLAQQTRLTKAQTELAWVGGLATMFGGAYALMQVARTIEAPWIAGVPDWMIFFAVLGVLFVVLPFRMILRRLSERAEDAARSGRRRSD